MVLAEAPRFCSRDLQPLDVGYTIACVHEVSACQLSPFVASARPGRRGGL